MAYGGHGKALISLLAACGLGGVGYGTHKYIRISPITPTSLTTRGYNATATVHIPNFASASKTSTQKIDASPPNAGVTIEVDGQPCLLPTNTAFRKQSSRGSPSYVLLFAGFASLFLPAILDFTTLGMLVCALASSLISILFLQMYRVSDFNQPPVLPRRTRIHNGTQTDKEDDDLSSLMANLQTAKDLITEIRQTVDPESISSESGSLDRVKRLKQGWRHEDEKHRERLSQLERVIVGQNTNLEQVRKHMRSLEDDDSRLKKYLKESEDEISRIIEQSSIEKVSYKSKKAHYKAVAHYIVSAADTVKAMEQGIEDSLQKRLRDILIDHDKKLLVSQQETGTLRTQLASETKRNIEISQKLAGLNRETDRENIAIEAEIKQQLLRTQKMEDAAADRERELRDELKKVQNERTAAVNTLESQIKTLSWELKTLRDENSLTLGDLRKYAEDHAHNLINATQEKEVKIAEAKAASDTLKSAILIWQRKEDVLTKANEDLERRIQELNVELTRSREQKEEQLRKEKSKHEFLVAQFKLKNEKLKTLEHHLQTYQQVVQAVAPEQQRSLEYHSHSNEGGTVQAETARGVEQCTFSNEKPAAEHAAMNIVKNSDEGMELFLPGHTLKPDLCASHPGNTPEPRINATSPQNWNVQIERGTSPDVAENATASFEGETSRILNAKPFASTSKGVAADSAAQNKPNPNLPTTSIPGLFPTGPPTGSGKTSSVSGVLDSTQPLPILTDFASIDFGGSDPATSQPSATTHPSPRDTAHRFTSIPSAPKDYTTTLSEGRRSTEAEINARRKLQPRRRNQTINIRGPMTPQVQSASLSLNADPASSGQPSKLELYDKAVSLGRVSLATWTYRFTVHGSAKWP